MQKNLHAVTCLKLAYLLLGVSHAFEIWLRQFDHRVCNSDVLDHKTGSVTTWMQHQMNLSCWVVDSSGSKRSVAAPSAKCSEGAAPAARQHCTPLHCVPMLRINLKPPRIVLALLVLTLYTASTSAAREVQEVRNLLRLSHCPHLAAGGTDRRAARWR